LNAIRADSDARRLLTNAGVRHTTKSMNYRYVDLCVALFPAPGNTRLWAKEIAAELRCDPDAAVAFYRLLADIGLVVEADITNSNFQPTAKAPNSGELMRLARAAEIDLDKDLPPPK
jgi:hypothetical protein